jgi:pimeloyl-ACP methyl ester carboxylesterase
MWEAQLGGLADRAHVIAPDLRGHGKSDAPASPYTMDQHADDLAALLDHLRVSRAVVAGFSMGGYATLAFWRRHSQRIAGLALVDTRAGADTPEGRAGRNATADRVRKRGVIVLAEEMLPRLLSTENQHDERLADRLREIILRQPAEGMIGALTAMRGREDSTAMLPSITVPTVVLVGEHDGITPPDIAVAMAKEIPEARPIVISNAGHMSPMENPAEVNMALGELLSLVRS